MINSMFEKDFYPTPAEVVDRMLAGLDLYGKTVLEPSAGSGNIVDKLKDFGARVIACEKNEKLATIVASKCELIANDFLQVTAEEVSHIDFIIANPPFSCADKHIMHMYEIAPGGCEIITLCNSQSLSNYSYGHDELAELVGNNGFSESLGQCFTTAERKTDVDVAMIHLFKPREANEFEFEGYFDVSEDYKNFEAGIMGYNELQDIVSRYVSAVQMYDEVMNVSEKINNLTNPFNSYGIMFGAYRTDNKSYGTITRDVFKKDLQKRAWKYVFNKMNMQKYVTKSVMEDINKFVEQQTHVPFTLRNIYKMIELIIGTHGDRMKNILVEVFDRICSFSAENSSAGEKWRTNSDYMVNKKFIVPYITSTEYYNNAYVCISYSARTSEIEDVAKALCFITGRDYSEMETLYETVQKKSLNWGSWYDWGFFRIKGFKKGTMHFEFKDEKVWLEFNRQVAAIKGWKLPKTTKKARAKRETVTIFGDTENE